MIISAVLLVLVTLLIGGILLRQMQNSEITPMRQVDVYSEQMRGLEHDRAKGVLADEEFDSMRAEIGRRMISAARMEVGLTNSASSGGLFPLVAVSFAACVVGAVIYVQLGSPITELLLRMSPYRVW